MDERRLRCLELAQRDHEHHEQTIERAEAYFTFLRGPQVSAPPQVLPHTSEESNPDPQGSPREQKTSVPPRSQSSQAA